jgi:hypothetical protein
MPSYRSLVRPGTAVLSCPLARRSEFQRQGSSGHQRCIQQANPRFRPVRLEASLMPTWPRSFRMVVFFPLASAISAAPSGPEETATAWPWDIATLGKRPMKSKGIRIQCDRIIYSLSPILPALSSSRQANEETRQRPRKTALPHIGCHPTARSTIRIRTSCITLDVGQSYRSLHRNTGRRACVAD